MLQAFLYLTLLSQIYHHLKAPRQGVPPIWDLHMGVLGNTGVYGSWWELAGVGGS